MPLFNWIKCNEGEINYIRREVKTDKITYKDQQKWIELNNEYIKKFGLSKLYERMLEAMRKKALLELEFVLTREKFKLTEAEIEETKLKNMMANNGNGMTIEQTLVYLSKWTGYHINTKKITVVDYFNLLEEYGKANKTK